ncbi:adenylate kinase isoenzyme 1-like isoform X2 [Ambystoma mexicanum]|uniref:adenylate kinase isoenzyme 1-like isoform X2 n=1 Tax=Ambystoma mexicanum TaxID=8296 RepID=UPI0037E952D6
MGNCNGNGQGDRCPHGAHSPVTVRSRLPPQVICFQSGDIVASGGALTSVDEKLKTQKIIFLIGGPGAGKDIQCERLVAKYGFTHMCMGDLLRVEASFPTSRGRQIRDIMQRGDIVPLDIVMTVLKDALLTKAESACGFLVDGFPREIGHPSLVVVFECSAETMVKRLVIRGQTSHRFDDNEDAIKRRMESYFKTDEPIIEFYNRKKLIRKILAEESPEDVFLKTCAVIDSLE